MNTRLLHSLLSAKRAGGYWDNTAVTARVLSAVDRLIKAENMAKTDVASALTLDGRSLLTAAFTGLDAKPASKTFGFKEFPLAAMRRDTPLPLRITRSGTGTVYWTASLNYALPAGTQGARDEGIGVFQTIRDLDSGEPVKENQLESGKLYRLELRVSSGRDRTYLALRAPVPSGAEILDASFGTTSRSALDAVVTLADGQEGGSGVPERRISHQAIFDNEVRYFWDAFPKGETSVQFTLRAARRGVYPTPPAQAECMYEPEIFGRTGGSLFTIK
jgi:uncharacterized protein YfaS (alpha-2-macroglobulin family)